MSSPKGFSWPKMRLGRRAARWSSVGFVRGFGDQQKEGKGGKTARELHYRIDNSSAGLERRWSDETACTAAAGVLRSRRDSKRRRCRDSQQPARAREAVRKWRNGLGRCSFSHLCGTRLAPHAESQETRSGAVGIRSAESGARKEKGRDADKGARSGSE